MHSFFCFTTDSGRFKYRIEFPNGDCIYQHDTLSNCSRYYCNGIDNMFSHFNQYGIKVEWGNI